MKDSHKGAAIIHIKNGISRGPFKENCFLQRTQIMMFRTLGGARRGPCLSHSILPAIPFLPIFATLSANPCLWRSLRNHAGYSQFSKHGLLCTGLLNFRNLKNCTKHVEKHVTKGPTPPCPLISSAPLSCSTPPEEQEAWQNSSKFQRMMWIYETCNSD